MVAINGKNIRNMLKIVSPLLIKPTPTSITVGLSKRFFLFTLINKAIRTIEEDPYLNFVSLLKNYKILGRILYGTAHEFYRDRNKLYFKHFFIEPDVWKLVKADLEWLHKEYPKLDFDTIKMTITKKGVIIYDNYKKNSFNLLLMTIHGGTWVPKNIQQKMELSPEQRYKEEDVETNKIYCRLIIEKGGIWIDNKMSRFACDFNRHISRCIYEDSSEKWINKLWKENLTKYEVQQLKQTYKEFYFALSKLVNTYRFNIIFDAHTMKDIDQRPKMSFGTKHIPKFYIPIVKSMHRKLCNLGYAPVSFNKPYKGGYILEWLSTMFPELFIFSMEINKKLYMTKNSKKSIKKKVKELSMCISKIFDIEIEGDELEFKKY